MANRLLKSSAGLLLVLILSSCQVPTRPEINIHMWKESGLPKAVCAAHPEVARSGIYRRLNDDACKAANKPIPCYEFLSYCNPRVAHYLSIQDEEYNKLLDTYLGKQQ